MPRKRTLTDDEVVEMYLSGVDSYTVGLRGNLDATQVCALVRKAGHQIRKRGGRPRTELAIPVEQAATLYDSGMSVQEIADRAGIDRVTMSNRLRKAGVQIRTLQEVADLKRMRRK